MVSGESVCEKLQREKREMREAVLATRDAMLPAVRATASRVIIEKVCSLPEYAQAKVVLTYMGFGSEIETDDFLERIIADGKIAILPRVDVGSRTLMLHPVHGVAELRAGTWGIREPRFDAPSVPISAINFALIPGVAFDHVGNRLGYGRGYYDKLLSSADPALARVAAAFSCQIVHAVPFGPNDKAVHSIITENDIIVTKNDR